jgi:hypothetical protein
MKWMFAAFLLVSMSSSAQTPNKVATAAPLKVPSINDTETKSPWKDPITWFTGGLLLVGGFQVWVYLRQTGLMEKSLEATQNAAEAARKSAVVAASAQIPKVALFKVDFGNKGASNWDAMLQSPVIEVMLKNYGPTTAFVEKVGLEVTWGIDLPSKPDDTHNYDVEPETVIDPQNTHLLSNKNYRPMISSEDVKAINEQKMFIWVYGHLQYLDFLNQRHITRFCKQLEPSVRQSGKYQFVQITDDPLYTKSG